MTTANKQAQLFMSRAEFETMKHDPQGILDYASKQVAMLEQQERALQEENQMLQKNMGDGGNRGGFTPEQHAQLIETASELTLDHNELSRKYVDIEQVNKNLEGLVTALRNDKEQLSGELTKLKDQQQKLILQNSEMTSRVGEVEGARTDKEQRLVTQQQEIDIKIHELDEIGKRVIGDAAKTIDLQDATEKIGTSRLSLESESTALEQTTQQQERSIAYLEAEVAHLDASIADKANEMVQLKKQMSGSVLELQLQITKAEEDMGRIRSTVSNENDLTGRQNLWLAKDLREKIQELMVARRDMAKDNAELKSELTTLREKSSRLKSNVLVYERQNQAFHDTLARLEAEDKYSKAGYDERKSRAYNDLNDTAAKVQRINQQLQTAREDLYVVKSKLPPNVRDSILTTQK